VALRPWGERYLFEPGEKHSKLVARGSQIGWYPAGCKVSKSFGAASYCWSNAIHGITPLQCNGSVRQLPRQPSSLGSVGLMPKQCLSACMFRQSAHHASGSSPDHRSLG
jgi:hypothetical protein